jgi:arylsulfate sulfotransferase
MSKVLSSTLVVALLAACGEPAGSAITTSPLSAQAVMTNLSISGVRPGPTPFIAFVQLSGSGLAQAIFVTYTLQTKPGSISQPVRVSYSMAALRRRGYIGDSTVTVPVFGLYAGFENQGWLSVVEWADLGEHTTTDEHTTETLRLDIVTPPYVDPAGIYDHPTIVKARPPGSALGFDFFAIKSAIEPLLIVDTDAEVRWIGTGMPSPAVLFENNGFVIGDPTGISLDGQRLELDGRLTTFLVSQPGYVDFHHNIDPGKVGWLAEFNTTTSFETTLTEIGPSGEVLQSWEMGSLLSAYMASRGDNPTMFVRPPLDWFHMNASTYDPRDDSLIVSSRENFVMKVDYSSGELIWILGDPTKYWATFPSLKAKALQLEDGGLYPIGQHATSITSDGLLMLFNDGYQSFGQPAGEPAGESRPYSAVSAYAIDVANMTAREVWGFDHGKSLDSIICSSAYEGPQGSVLLDYAVADAGTNARLVGLDANHEVVFEFAYVNPTGCDTSWNAVPVPLDNMQFP